MATRSWKTRSQTRAQQSYRKRKAKAPAKTTAHQAAAVRRVEALPAQNEPAAGIDIGDYSHWVCVGFGETADPDGVRAFATHTDGLYVLLGYLQEHHVTTVAMESSGVYWIPLWPLLEANGIEVILVDGHYTKQVKGRPKTDRRDCQWSYRLHRAGLLAAAFRPDAKTCTLRAYLRQRAHVLRYASQHLQHLEKALEQMKLKLRVVLTDITGVTGRAIIQAILKGTRDPHKLAQFRPSQCQATEAEIAQALHGSYHAEHLFELRQAYEAWPFYQRPLDKVDTQIAQQLQHRKRDRALPPLPPRSRPRRRQPNRPRFDVRTALYDVVGIDRTEIEGIDELTALTVISAIGPDVSKFATVKHFCSWLGLCPQLQKTGGRIRSSRTRPGVNRAAVALRLAANGCHASKGALGAFLRRLKARHGAPKAVTATAHQLARIVYLALKHGMTYVRQTQEEYAERQRVRQIEALKRKARQLGFEVTAKEATPPPPTASAAPTS